jgi:hypothetical protein
VPFVAMRYTTEVNWTGSDFVVAFVLLFGSSLAYELISRKESADTYKAAAGIAVFMVLALVWINAAVGIIGDEDNPVNLLYGGVLLIGLIGAILSRLRPRGMSRTLYAVAVAQMLVPTIALIANPQVLSELPGVIGVFVLNAGFAVIWVASGLLFQRAAKIRA